MAKSLRVEGAGAKVFDSCTMPATPIFMVLPTGTTI
jgi:hypothetical protein